MARPWRLRHKLLLGLLLVAGTIAALLAGTLHGLASYVGTMKTADSKLSELQAAEELRTAIAALAAPSDAGLAEEPAHLAALLSAVRVKHAAYQARLQNTIAHHHDPDGGYQESRLSEDLLTWTDHYDAALKDALKPRLVGDDAPRSLTEDPAVKSAQAKLVQIADELRKAIYDDMYRRIDLAKRDHRRSTFIAIGCSILAVAMTGGLLLFFYGWVFHPIQRLQAGVGRIAQGDFDHRLKLKSGDELEDLADAFDDMTERLQTLYRDLNRQVEERSRQLVRSERLVSVGFLAAVGNLEQPLVVPLGAGERPAAVPEQFALDQVLVEPAAVHRDERPLGPPALLEQGPGHQFLAGPGLAQDQDR